MQVLSGIAPSAGRIAQLRCNSIRVGASSWRLSVVPQERRATCKSRRLSRFIWQALHEPRGVSWATEAQTAEADRGRAKQAVADAKHMQPRLACMSFVARRLKASCASKTLASRTVLSQRRCQSTSDRQCVIPRHSCLSRSPRPARSAWGESSSSG